MRRSSWYALLLVAILGWGAAGLLAVLLVERIGWLGILILGLVTLVVALQVQLDADAPSANPYLMRRQYEQASEGNAEARLARWAERLERNRWLYIVRTIGIALVLLGLNMFVTHQL